TARPVLAAAARLHDGRGAFLERVDAHGEEAQHILIDAHGALHLAHRGMRRLDVEEDVVALAILLDAVGEGAQTPIFALLDLAAALADDAGESLRQALDLRRGDVLARNEYRLVQTHMRNSLWLLLILRWSSSTAAARIEPGGPGKEQGRALYTSRSPAQAARGRGRDARSSNFLSSPLVG